jgi:hypothetical protein
MNDFVFKSQENGVFIYKYILEGLVDFPGEIEIDRANLKLRICTAFRKGLRRLLRKKSCGVFCRAHRKMELPDGFYPNMVLDGLTPG